MVAEVLAHSLSTGELLLRRLTGNYGIHCRSAHSDNVTLELLQFYLGLVQIEATTVSAREKTLYRRLSNAKESSCQTAEIVAQDVRRRTLY